MKTLRVKVRNDHLERMSKVQKPIAALEEIIWNGLDADAGCVRVSFCENPLGGFEEITVSDDGHGLAYKDAVSAFENLGGSWKRAAGRTKRKHRKLHGQAGKGRFRAFALGTAVTWITRFEKGPAVHEYSICGQRTNLGTFEISDPIPCTRSVGTDVHISRIEKNFRSLSGSRAIQEITERFALYLRQYPDACIIYDGTKIDPSLVEEHIQDYQLNPITLDDGRIIDATLTVIEWKATTERALYLCDAEGFSLAEIPPGIQAPGYNFTAYLRSAHLRELDEQNALVLEELHPDLRRLLDSARDELRGHFRRRTAEGAIDLVAEWKRDNLYPYQGEPANVLEETERQVFDVVALNLNNFLPDFERADSKSKRFALQLLKLALEDSPSAVRRIFQDVLDLPKDKQEEFAELLERTTLAAVINAAKVVAGRLDFLLGIEMLVFKPELKEHFLERGQLHRLLATNTWIFGEEYNLTVDNQSLTEVLKKHLHLLGRNMLAGEPVVREDGSVGIVDLMLSRLLPQPRANEREHLVIELKRPNQPIDSEVAAQIKSYAFAVADDERFLDTKTRWNFWAVSNEITPSVRREARQHKRPEGLLYDDEDQRIRVWVKTWGEIIEECRGRLHFFEENLCYVASQESARTYLQQTYAKYLPKAFKTP